MIDTVMEMIKMEFSETETDMCKNFVKHFHESGFQTAVKNMWSRELMIREAADMDQEETGVKHDPFKQVTPQFKELLRLVNQYIEQYEKFANLEELIETRSHMITQLSFLMGLHRMIDQATIDMINAFEKMSR